MIRVIFLCLIAWSISGCTTGVQNLKKSSNYALNEGEAAVVIGLKPDNLLIALHAGVIVDGRFEIPSKAKPSAAGQAQDGYLVIKAKPGDLLAITSVLRKPSASQLSGRHKTFCSGEKVYAFQVPKAGVFYLADFTLRETNNSLLIDPTVNSVSAKKFMLEQMNLDATQTIPIIGVPSGAFCFSHVGLLH
jgi:hypothetical protein